MGNVTYDTIVRNGRWFDGTGAPSAVRNIGIRGGHIAIVTEEELDTSGCPQVIEASGKWVLPGMIDIHTHYDVEVLNGPALAESLRHGVTTVLLGSCSLSTVHVGAVDAGDLFGRVEAIPRDKVIAAVEANKTWSDCEEYIGALESRPLGPNVAAFIGHSDIRTAVMGLDRATRVDARPTRAEQADMEQMLAAALDAGFVGMSSQQLLFDKLTAKCAVHAPCRRPTPDHASFAGSSRCSAAPGGCCSPDPTSRTRSTSSRRPHSPSASSATRSRRACCRPPTSRPTPMRC